MTYTVLNQDSLTEAIEMYGKELVTEVIEMVELTDPDGAYTQYEDYGMYIHAEIVDMLFFGH